MDKHNTKRDKRIDSLRGLFLVIMTIDHFGGILSKVTYQTFGYVSAAEGFIFLSGYVFTIVYMKYAQFPTLLISKCLKRAWFVYKYHFALIVIIFLSSLYIPIYHEMWAAWLCPNHLDTYLGLMYTAMLLHYPVLMDILPMYVLFILISPLILITFFRGYILHVLCISISIWIVGQSLNVTGGIINILEINTQSGLFNLFSWQLIWTMGMFFGYLKITNIDRNLYISKLLIYVVLAFSFIMFLYRHQLFEFGYNFILDYSGRQDLEIFRLLNFLSILFLLWVLMKNIPTYKGIPWLQFLGQYSIQVFSFHVLLVYFLQPIWLNIDQSNNFQAISFILLVVASLSIPAYLAKKLKNSTRRNKKL